MQRWPGWLGALHTLPAKAQAAGLEEPVGRIKKLLNRGVELGAETVLGSSGEWSQRASAGSPLWLVMASRAGTLPVGCTDT